MKKKVVFITGCSSGIGRALSEEFHAKGYRVIATARHLESLDELKSKGMSVERLDVTNPDHIEHVITTVLSREQKVDILINNAGFGLIAPTLDIPEPELRLQFQTNVFAPLALIRQITPSMKESGGGTIVNIGSISGIVTTPFGGAYCASKAALHSFSDALRMELAPFGIRVITVEPGGIGSNFGNASEKTANRVMTPNSWYAPIRGYVGKRAQESQSGATPSDEFARSLVKILSDENPPAEIRLGHRSFFLPFIKRILPTRILDSVFSARYGLTVLRQGYPPSHQRS